MWDSQDQNENSHKGQYVRLIQCLKGEFLYSLGCLGVWTYGENLFLYFIFCFLECALCDVRPVFPRFLYKAIFRALCGGCGRSHPQLCEVYEIMVFPSYLWNGAHTFSCNYLFYVEFSVPELIWLIFSICGYDHVSKWEAGNVLSMQLHLMSHEAVVSSTYLSLTSLPASWCWA